MPAPTVISSWFDDVLLNLQAALIDRLSFLPEQVLIRMAGEADEDASPPTAEQYIVLYLNEFKVNLPVVVGGGRDTPWVERKIQVIAKSRSLLDSSLDDVEALINKSNQSLGHLAFELNLFNALLDYIPMDPTQNWLVVVPVPIKGGTTPSKHKSNHEWSATTLDLDITLIARIDRKGY